MRGMLNVNVNALNVNVNALHQNPNKEACPSVSKVCLKCISLPERLRGAKDEVTTCVERPKAA